MSGITSVLGLMGTAAYVCLYTFSVSVLEELGTTPEEVGITQARLLVRAGAVGLALTLAVVMIALVLSVVLVGLAWLVRRVATGRARRGLRTLTAFLYRWRFTAALVGWMRRPDHMWSSGEAGRLRRTTWVIALTCGSVFVLIAELAYPGFATTTETGGEANVAFTAYMVALFAGGFGLLARWRHVVAFSVLAVVVLGWGVYVAAEAGADTADRIRDGDLDDTAMDALGFPAQRVCVTWIGARPETVPEDADVQLGTAGGSVLLTDGRLLYRVNASQISVVTVAAHPEHEPRC